MTRQRFTDLVARYPFSVLYLLACVLAVAMALLIEHHL